MCPALRSPCRFTTQLRLLAKSQRKHGLAKVHLALMTGLENNPVLAAYGAIRSGTTQAVAGAGAGAAEGGGMVDWMAAGGGSGELGSAPSGPSEVLLTTAASGAEDAASSGSAGALAAPQPQQMVAAQAQAQAWSDPPTRGQAAAPPEHKAAAEALAAHLQRQKQPNRYGYRPIANEWDIWWVWRRSFTAALAALSLLFLRGRWPAAMLPHVALAPLTRRRPTTAPLRAPAGSTLRGLTTRAAQASATAVPASW